jgi:hypothetical protein
MGSSSIRTVSQSGEAYKDVGASEKLASTFRVFDRERERICNDTQARLHHLIFSSGPSRKPSPFTFSLFHYFTILSLALLAAGSCTIESPIVCHSF